MIALGVHEIRVICRRAVWPAALTLHAFAASVFVALWGPTGGVPLWQASVLQQFAAAERLLLAILLTWLATFVLADDAAAGRSAADWGALTGRRVDAVLRARLAALALLTAVLLAVAMPALVAAGDLSAATRGEIARQLGAAAGFACLCVGVTAIAAVAQRDRVAIWCTAMLCSAAAALGVRWFDTELMRAVVPLGAGAAMLALALLAARNRRAANAA
jgi:hypothetical protein